MRRRGLWSIAVTFAVVFAGASRASAQTMRMPALEPSTWISGRLGLGRYQMGERVAIPALLDGGLAGGIDVWHHVGLGLDVSEAEGILDPKPYTSRSYFLVARVRPDPTVALRFGVGRASLDRDSTRAIPTRGATLMGLEVFRPTDGFAPFFSMDVMLGATGDVRRRDGTVVRDRIRELRISAGLEARFRERLDPSPRPVIRRR